MKRCCLLLLLAVLVDGALHPVWGEALSGPVASITFNGAAVSSTGQPVVMPRAVLGTGRCGRMNSALQLYPVDHALAQVDGVRLGAGALQDFAAAAWIFPREVEGYRVIVEKFAAEGQQRGFRLAVKDGRLRFWWSSTGKVEDPGEYDSVVSEAVIPVGKWTHVAVSFREGSVRLYVNGEPDVRSSSDVEAVFMGSAPLGIGGNPATTGFLFDGLVDSVVLWNRPLEKDEVAAMHAGGCE